MHAGQPLDDTHGPSAFVGMLLALGLSLLATRAHAAPCSTDADCPERFTCVTAGKTACAAPPSCAADADCSALPPCQTADIKVCRSGECRGDSDCPDDMVCYRARPRPSCLPRYLLPCAHDSDCGDGFDCNTERQDDPHCVLERASCSSAQDCPARFSCEVDPALAACDAQDAGADEDASTSRCTSDGNVCLPPYAAIDFIVPQPSAHGGDVGPIVERWGSPGAHSHWGCSVSAVADRHAARGWFAALLSASAMFGVRARRRRVASAIPRRH